MTQANQKVNEKNIYITKWVNDVEKYVKYDGRKDDYIEVKLNEAQSFESKEEAEKFAEMVYDFGYEKPEIVTVEVKTIA
ncbi:MAG: hypothetical protein N2645_13040 [Clostridia bacterium]|nr:hypothetical protein [Clostridia bacterium]